MTKRVLLVTTGDERKRSVLERIKELGYHLIVLESEKNWAQGFADDWILADTNDATACLKAVEAYRTKKTIDGIVTFDEFAVELCAHLVTELGYPGVTTDIAQTCRDKYKFRQFCQDQKLPSIDFKLIESAADIEYVQAHFTAPVIVKPTKAAGSQQVQAVEDLSELNFATHKGFLVETLLQGQEVDIDILVQDGHIKYLTLSDHSNTDWPYFVQDKASIPSSLELKIQQKIKDLSVALVNKLNIKNACLHLEVVANDLEVCPIEINLRMGASGIYAFNEAAYNVDLIESSLKICTNTTLAINTTPQLAKHAVTHYFCNQDSGTISDIMINKTLLNQHQHMAGLSFFAKIGDTVAPPPKDFRSLGYLVATGKNKKQAEDHLQELLQFVDYTVSNQ